MFESWQAVPSLPPPGTKVFVEVFAGEAGISAAAARAGAPCLPPIEKDVKGSNAVSTSVFDPEVAEKFSTWARAGAIEAAHFGTPCTTYSAARKWDGGPRPLRSTAEMEGLRDLPERLRAQTDEGTIFMKLTATWASEIGEAGGC